tara:strand:- start:237 stop:488 length:252 start_codon:yes stop_codon:yes gene_type:complete
LDFEKRVITNFAYLFEQKGEKETFKTSRTIEWGWYHFLIELANDDVLKLDAVGEIPIEKALLFLMYRKDKNEQQTNRLKKNRT